jgi:hypothetical protein
MGFASLYPPYRATHPMGYQRQTGIEYAVVPKKRGDWDKSLRLDTVSTHIAPLLHYLY